METIKITTPIDKIVVELRAWITGKERRELRRPILEEIKFGFGASGEADIKGGINSVKMMEKSENLAIETIVVSVNGAKDKIVDRVLDMKAKDSEFVIDKVLAIRDLKDESFLESGGMLNSGIDKDG